MVFEQKKIQLETLGEYLREVRQSSGLSLEEVSAKTGIKPQFLSALENGEFKFLPPDVYVFGFLRQLAEVYTVGTDDLLRQYKKEKGIQNQIEQRIGGQRSWLKRRFGRLVITPAVLSLLAGGLFVAVSLIYIIWQVASINKVPRLDVDQPQDRQVVNGSFITVHGRTDPGMSATVNGQDVFVNDQGLFQAQMGIEAGPQDLQIIASNKFGKTTTRQLSVTGQPDVVATSTAVTLQLQFSGQGTAHYSIDGGDSQTLAFRNGDSKVLVGQQKIVVSTTDAGATVVIFNGQRLGPLGRPGEQLLNIPFFADASAIKSP